MNAQTKNHVYTGLRLGFGAVAGICTIGLLAYGFAKIRTPEVDNSVFTFVKGYPPRVVGGIVIALASAILLFTVNRWAKMLSGFFWYAAFGGILAVVRGGFHSQISSLSLTRLEAAMMTALIAACALLTRSFSQQNLSLIDHVAALSVPFLMVWAATSTEAPTSFKALAALLVIFVVAGSYDYLCRRPQRRSDRKNENQGIC